MTTSYAEFRPIRFAFAPLIGIASRLAALGGYPRNTADGKTNSSRLVSSQYGKLGRFGSPSASEGRRAKARESAEIPRMGEAHLRSNKQFN